MIENIVAAEQPAGMKVRTESGTWMALGGGRGWMHEGGSRKATDLLIQQWLDSGKAQVVS
jgi:hypothetical protein